MATLKIPVTSHDHIKGNIKAPITLIEYGDFECPHCATVYPIVKNIQRQFSKQLKFVFRHFPLAQIHPHAEMAAETAEWADTHKKFWEIHGLLFEQQARLDKSIFPELAASLGLDVANLQYALASKMYYPKIRSQFTGGVRSGVHGTPTFFINNERYNGQPTLTGLMAAIKGVME